MAQLQHLRLYAVYILLALFALLEVVRQSALKKTESPVRILKLSVKQFNHMKVQTRILYIK